MLKCHPRTSIVALLIFAVFAVIFAAANASADSGPATRRLTLKPRQLRFLKRTVRLLNGAIRRAERANHPSLVKMLKTELRTLVRQDPGRSLHP